MMKTRYQPEFYLLDGNGNLLQKWVGFTPQEQFEEVFAQYVQWQKSPQLKSCGDF